MDIDVNKLIEQQAKLLKLVNHLKAENKRLQTELEKHSHMSIMDISFGQFKSQLKLRFDENDMPKVGGIYAYYNPRTEQLYIGQSVNMYNRLKQHFRNGKIKLNGHDEEFKNSDEWQYYVLEYIHRDNKKLMDDREAYWIALAKVATADKKAVDKKAIKEFENKLYNGNALLNKFDGPKLDKTFKESGSLTNRTRGNNVRM